MYRYKTAVYAICKNEIKHAERWYRSVSSADQIYVLDTGSTDGTAELLESLGAHVVRMEITPWRFDTARNMAMDLVPQNFDICVSCDLDEVFREGWRDALDRLWHDGLGRVHYRFVYSISSEGEESSFYRGLIHSRQGYRWKYPIHEYLMAQKNALEEIKTDEITLIHLPDNDKSRGDYLPLLEAAAKEYPGDARMLHYLGREQMFRGLYKDAISTLAKCLEICTWAPERSATLRYIGRCCHNLDRPNEAVQAFMAAIESCPGIREPYVELAFEHYEEGSYRKCLEYALAALAIDYPSDEYLKESFAWGYLPWDLASFSCWQLGFKQRALFYARRALLKAPNSKRLAENCAFIQSNI